MSRHHSDDDPPPNLPIIKASPPEPSADDDSENQRSTPRGDSGDESGYRTPTSIESRIPAVLTCPPAPRKPRALRKRRAAEEESFEKIHRAEIEALFRSCEESGAVVVLCAAAAKRRCLCK